MEYAPASIVLDNLLLEVEVRGKQPPTKRITHHACPPAYLTKPLHSESGERASQIATVAASVFDDSEPAITELIELAVSHLSKGGGWFGIAVTNAESGGPVCAGIRWVMTCSDWW